MNMKQIKISKPKKIEKTLLFLGDCEVGKTALLQQFIRGEMPLNYQTTIVLNYYNKDLDDLTLCIYDSNGEEIEKKILTPNFIRNTDCFVVVMSYHKIQSVDIALQYLNFIKESPNYKKQQILALVNKKDIKNKEFNLNYAVERLRNDFPNIYIGETTAVDQVSVGKLFNSIVNLLKGIPITNGQGNLFFVSSFKIMENTESIPGKKKCC